MVNSAIRSVVEADLSEVVHLVKLMFAELGTTEIPDQWQGDIEDALRTRIGDDVVAVVAVDDNDRPIALALGVVDHRLPSPRRPDGAIGYVEWLVTDPDHRRQGAARAALTELLARLDARVPTIDVHSSASAASLYADLGFRTPAARPMRR